MQGSGSGGVVIDLAETNIWMHPGSRGDMPESVAARRLSAAVVVDGSGGLRFGAESSGDDEQCVLGVLGRLGDPVPLLVGDRLVPAALLIAGQIDAALTALLDDPGDETQGVTVIHPDHVRATDIMEVVEHLDHDGPIRWISRGRLVAETLSESGAVGVVHIGSTTAEVGLWSESPSRLMSPPVTRRGTAGRLVDELIARAVTDSVAGRGVVSDPGEAKHRLARETAVDVSAGDVSVRLVRDELRTMVDQVAGPVIEALEICLRRGRVSRGDLQRIVLIGGSASLPGLVEQISSWCDVPVSVEPRVGRLVATLEQRETAEDGQPFLITARAPAATTPVSRSAEAHPARPRVARAGAADRVRSALARGRRRRLSEPRVRLSRRTGVAAVASLALLGVASVSGAAPVMTSARLVMEVFAAADDGSLTADGGDNAVAEVSRVALRALPLSEENRERIVETLPPMFIAIPQDDQTLDEEGHDDAKPWQTPSADDDADENGTATPLRTTGPKSDNARKPATPPAGSKSTGRPSTPGKPSASTPSKTKKPPSPTPAKTTPSGPPSSSPGPATPDPAPAPEPTPEPSAPPAPEPTSDPPAPEPTSEPSAPPAPEPTSDPPAPEPTSDPGDTGTP